MDAERARLNALLSQMPAGVVMHFKPGDEALIYQECVDAMPEFNVHQIKGGEVFKF